jgi:hypothetical protein
MATEVLQELMYTICELYLDDLLVHATTWEEYLHNLRRVFQRLREFGVTLNPRKVKLGQREVEVVGHLISEHGIRFTDEKIEGLLSIVQPRTKTAVKQFIGLANYFRDHIRDLSKFLLPLQNLIPKYSKAQAKEVVVWTEEADIAFTSIRQAIKTLPTLYFISTDPTHTIVLETDACDIGIGAYLYQIIDGNAHPIAFVSKALTEAEQRWATNTKEAYAIYYAFIKLAYLIRDVHFILRTDHQNLTYLDAGEGKILRWKLAILEYDFDVEYIPGPENVAADGLSRLCTMFSTLSALSDQEVMDPTFRIPPAVYKRISSIHNSTVGHFGEVITLQRVIANGEPIPYIREYVRKFIRQCPCCQKMSELKLSIHTTPFVTSSFYPMQRLNIDTIGPLPTTKYGQEHILVIIDTFTRFVELYAIRDTSAEEAANAVIQHIGRWGCPSIIRTDGGSQFKNHTLESVLKYLTIEHQIAIPYSKEESAIVERSNKEVMRHLRAMILDKRVKDTWSLFLPFVQRIINAKVHDSTGVAPMQLISVNLNLNQHLLDAANVNKFTDLGEYTSNLIHRQRLALDVAHTHQAEKTRGHLTDYAREFNEFASLTKFNDNEYVLIAYPEGHRPSDKLMCRWKGPMQVVRHTGAAYTIRDFTTMKEETVHVSRIKPYLSDGHNDPEQIALAEGCVWEIKCIHSHRIEGKSRKNYSFLVEWAGYPLEVHWTWELWTANLARTQAMITYLHNTKGLSYLIPKGLRHNNSPI